MSKVEIKYTPGRLISWDEADQTWDEALKTWEESGDQGRLEINIEEDLTFNESYFSKIRSSFRETLNINDYNFGSANVVLYDLKVSPKEITSEDFTNLISNISPIGYEPMRPLYPGEYTYDEAIIGIQVEAKLNEARIGVYGCLLSVDVEDITDRSTDYVNSIDINAPTKILFKRKFYKSPEEIVFNVRSSQEPAFAEVVEKNPEYFTVMLKGLLSGEYVLGTIEWVATGY